ncbi:MAG: ImmA/IrrE family metallo-endopeptidase [Neptuniibacter sp.]
MNEERQGAEEAEGLLESLVGFDSLPIKPEEVAEELNDKNFELIYEKQPFNSEKLLGKAIGNTRKAIIYINQNIEDRGRSNFTAAHEIGHVCLHIMPGDYEEFSCGTQQLYNPYNDPVEKQANGFASGLLMPRVLLKEISDGDINWQNIDRIKKTCLASYEATFRRMISL